ncbi:DUF1826 domain-containing protein [uncultured Lamprocystis sp.]|jgi:hypothetical protein|uniref:DUF1826 domain-containing protein n=2 Tax=uncultured Lamprocystis sp. TaxID=543132 RepID=UPI0025EB54DC|nr:DUF1826 domain-containing protein [uncultured Lamprocystis sp.]
MTAAVGALSRTRTMICDAVARHSRWFRRRRDRPTTVFTSIGAISVIMKGAIYPDDRAVGLVHRSPPIAGTGETRILSCLDA